MCTSGPAVQLEHRQGRHKFGTISRSRNVAQTPLTRLEKRSAGEPGRMSGLFRRAVAALVAVSFVLVQGGPEFAATGSASPIAGGHNTLRLPHTIVAPAAPPVRLPVPEPPRPRVSPPSLSAMRPKLVPAVRPLNGRHVPGWPMLRPTEIDGVLKAAAAARRRGAGMTVNAPAATG